jgi:hypothetical protein
VLTELRHHLDRIRANLKLDSSSEKEILCELYTHFEDRVEELEEAGFSEEEATKAAAQYFGPLKAVASELNEVHSSINWAQTITAALPHLLFALLFALHQWSNVSWLSVILISIVGVAIYGWRHNKPVWFFPWLGYALVPLWVVGFILLGQALNLNSLARSWWIWLAVIVYFPIILWLFISILVQTLRRDWLLGSLMALPLPAIVGWFLTAQQDKGLLGESRHPLYDLTPWIVLSFLTLAAIVILFTRLRQRHLKTGVLLAAGLAILILIACSSGGSIGFPNLAVIALITLFILLGPALLEHRIAHQEAEAWDYLSERDLHE